MRSFYGKVTAALVLGASGCDPDALVNEPQIRSTSAPWSTPRAAWKLDVTFQSNGSVSEDVGYLLSKNGTEAKYGACMRTSDGPGYFGIGPSVSCALPALDVGSYWLSISGDRSCGPKSYWKTDVLIDIIEPAHVSSVTPPHGPEKAETHVTVSGTNIGGPHVVCEYEFEAGKGAASDGSGNPLGCSMTSSARPTSTFTANSVSCVMPAWPGPLQQCGKDGCHPLKGAVCSKKVRISITNDAKVHSPESLYFTYDDSATVVV